MVAVEADLDGAVAERVRLAAELETARAAHAEVTAELAAAKEATAAALAEVTAATAAHRSAVADLTELRRRSFREDTEQSVAVSRLKAAMEQATKRLEIARRERDEARAELEQLRSGLSTQPHEAARPVPAAQVLARGARSAVRLARRAARRIVR